MSKRKKIIIAVVVIFTLIAIGIGAVGVKFFLEKQEEEEQRRQRVAAIAASADDIVNRVTEILTSNVPATWVYDSEENLLMTLKVTTAIQSVSEVPAVLSATVLTSCSNDPWSLVCQEYFLSLGQTPVGELYEGYLLRLRSSFQQADLVRYLAVCSLYSGRFTGVTDACYNYFGVGLSELNDAQIAFITYCYRNDYVDVDKYLTDNGLTADRLGLLSANSGYYALRDLVLSELGSLSGVDLERRSYLVKLTISSQQQNVYQSVTDNAMRQLIDLNADGSYAVNCSVALVDKTTGFVRAYIPGRTTREQSSAKFQLNALNFPSNYSALMLELRKPYTYDFSLREVTKANGDKELKSIRTLFETLSLSSDASDSYLTPLDYLDILYTGSSLFGGVSLIYQVKEIDGETVYASQGVGRMVFDNSAVPEFFATEKETRTTYGMYFELSTGVLSWLSTPSYDLAIVAGSGAVGGASSVTAKARIEETVLAIQSAVAALYPTPSGALWDSKRLMEEESIAYDNNFILIEKSFEEMLDALQKIEVDSVESRKAFENQYETLSKFITEYTQYLGDAYADSLRQRLIAVRLAVADLLMRYSV